MTREEWLLVKRIAAGALDQPEEHRSTYLVSACRGGQAIEEEVRSLLSFTDQASHRFATAAFAWPALAADHVLGAVDPAHRDGRAAAHQAPSRQAPSSTGGIASTVSPEQAAWEPSTTSQTSATPARSR